MTYGIRYYVQIACHLLPNCKAHSPNDSGIVSHKNKQFIIILSHLKVRVRLDNNDSESISFIVEMLGLKLSMTLLISNLFQIDHSCPYYKLHKC